MDYTERIENQLLLGVLNLTHIKELVRGGIVRNMSVENIDKELAKSDSSTIDLRISDLGWRLGSSAKPKIKESIESLMRNYDSTKLKNLQQGEVLQPGNVYLIRIMEEVRFQKKYNLFAQASGKSSIGRLDVLTRLLVDGSPLYDLLPEAYSGPLYAEVIPLSFPILVRTGDSLNQLRLFRGKPEENKLPETRLSEMSEMTPLILTEKGSHKRKEVERLSIDLTISTSGSIKASAFVARNSDKIEPIDLKAEDKSYNPRLYWEPRKMEPKGMLLMEKNRFYILRSKERFYLPQDVAVRCIAYTENLGETRIHYAGFAHPWFARDNPNKTGAPLIFEVRCHSFPIVARDGEDFARIEFYKMAEPTTVKTPYDSQELKLSRYFDDWK